MPPEQAEGRSVDERADVYALGAMLYHLLAGRPPYDGKDSQAVLMSVVADAPPSIELVEPTVPRELSTIVGKAMQRSPADRYLNAARAGAPEGSHCGGVCACSTCHVYVHKGAELLSLADDDEIERLDLSAQDRRDNSRLGCQARLLGDGVVEVEVSEESFQVFCDANPKQGAQALRRWLRIP